MDNLYDLKNLVKNTTIQKSLYHSSYINEFISLEELNIYKAKSITGRKIITIVSKMYFLDEVGISINDIHKIRIENIQILIYKTIKLDDFIILGKGEKKTRLSDSMYIDSLDVLVYTIYKEFGFSFVKNFIYKYLSKHKIIINSEENIDAKSILYEYAEQNKILNELNFNVVKVEGPEHSKLYHMELYFMGERFIDIGKSKKEVEQKLSYQIVKQKDLINKINKKNKNRNKQIYLDIKALEEYKLSNKRLNDIKGIFRKIEIEKSYIEYNYMDIIFTHKSIKNTREKYNQSNELFIFLGEDILEFIISEYLLENLNELCDGKSGIVNNQKSKILTFDLSKNLFKNMSDEEISKFITKTRGSINIDIKFKNELFKAFLGGVFTYCFNYKPEYMTLMFNYFKYELVESISGQLLKNSLDYNDIMFNYMQNINADIIIENLIEISKTPNTKLQGNAKIKGNEYLAKKLPVITVEGASKREVKNNACKIIYDVLKDDFDMFSSNFNVNDENIDLFKSILEMALSKKVYSRDFITLLGGLCIYNYDEKAIDICKKLDNLKLIKELKSLIRIWEDKGYIVYDEILRYLVDECNLKNIGVFLNDNNEELEEVSKLDLFSILSNEPEF